MRADADFMVFVAARWVGLVREAVLLGSPPELAAAATTDALSRCRRDWGRASQEENVDHLVRDELVAAVARRPRTPPEGREDAAEQLLVLAPPTLDDLEDQQRRNRVAAIKRGRWVIALLVVAGLGIATYALAFTADTPPQPADPDDLSRAVVTREANPVPDVFWWADGELHLGQVVVEVPDLRDVTRLGAGAVYGDAAGRVVYAGDDGGLLLLGHKDPGVPVAATDETGLAAWYDPDTRKVHVVEASTGNVRLETEVGDEPEVVAVDGDVVYLVGEQGARALLPTGSTSETPVSPAALLDVRSRIRVFQKDPGTLQIIQSAFNEVFEVPGHGAELSPDGNTVATRDPNGGVQLYDTRSGQQVDGRLGGGSPVQAVMPGERGIVAYVITVPEGTQLRTCRLENSHCPTIDIVALDSRAVLAR